MKTSDAARPLRSTGVTPLRRYSEPSRRRLVFSRFPGVTGYTTDLLHRLLDGTRTVSPVARHALVTVLPLTTPPEWQAASSARDLSCCLRPEPESSASGVIIFSRPPLGSLALRPGDSLAIPKMALSVGFIRFVSSTDATVTTELLTLTLVGLIPTEHVCLVWTHWCANNHAADPAGSRSS